MWFDMSTARYVVELFNVSLGFFLRFSNVCQQVYCLWRSSVLKGSYRHICKCVLLHSRRKMTLENNNKDRMATSLFWDVCPSSLNVWRVALSYITRNKKKNCLLCCCFRKEVDLSILPFTFAARIETTNLNYCQIKATHLSLDLRHQTDSRL